MLPNTYPSVTTDPIRLMLHFLLCLFSPYAEMHCTRRNNQVDNFFFRPQRYEQCRVFEGFSSRGVCVDVAGCLCRLVGIIFHTFPMRCSFVVGQFVIKGNCHVCHGDRSSLENNPLNIKSAWMFYYFMVDKQKWSENPFVENNHVNKCQPINSLMVPMANEKKITFKWFEYL